MGGRAVRDRVARGRPGRSAAWSWSRRTCCIAAALGCSIVAVEIHGVGSPRGIGVALLLTTAGVPLPSTVSVEVPVLWWLGHVLFWTPVLSLLLGRFRRLRRGWRRRGLRSGDPAARAAALGRDRRH